MLEARVDLWDCGSFCTTSEHQMPSDRTVHMIISVCVYVYCEICACMLSRFSGVQLFVTLWAIAHQASPSIGFSRHGYWSGLSCPPQGDLPNPGIEPMSLTHRLGSTLCPEALSTPAWWHAHLQSPGKLLGWGLRRSRSYHIWVLTGLGVVWPALILFQCI